MSPAEIDTLKQLLETLANQVREINQTTKSTEARLSEHLHLGNQQA